MTIAPTTCLRTEYVSAPTAVDQPGKKHADKPALPNERGPLEHNVDAEPDTVLHVRAGLLRPGVAAVVLLRQCRQAGMLGKVRRSSARAAGQSPSPTPFSPFSFFEILFRYKRGCQTADRNAAVVPARNDADDPDHHHQSTDFDAPQADFAAVQHA